MKYTLKNKEIELTDEEVKEIVKQNTEPKEEKSVGLEIKNRFTGEVIFTSTKTVLKEAVEEAVGDGADLENTELMNASFFGKGGTQELTEKQVPVFLKALGFIIKDNK